MNKSVDGDLALKPLPHLIMSSMTNAKKTDVTFDKFLSSISSVVGYDMTRASIKLHKAPNRKVVRPKPHSVKKLTYRERRRLGLYTLGRNEIGFKPMLLIHNLWKNYMRSVLNLKHLKSSRWENTPEHPNFEQVSVKLYRADYHGALITVVQSKCASLAGLSGIVAMETKNCFRIVGKDDKCRVVPKQISEFEFTIDDFKFSFFGKNLIVRPAERSNRKLKAVLPPCI